MKSHCTLNSSSSTNSLFAVALSIYFSPLKSSFLLVARELYMVCDGWGPQIGILCWPWISPFFTFLSFFLSFFFFDAFELWCWGGLLKNLFNWRLITLQYCSGFCHTLTWVRHGCTCVLHPETPSHLSPHPIPLGHPSAPALSTLSHALNLDWQSTSHTIIYMFQCYYLKSSHPRLLPQSPKVCSLHLCLFCCLTYRVIIIIFLNSIYMH